MIMTNRILPVALVAALIGGSVGAFVMHSRNTTEASPATLANTRSLDGQADAKMMDAGYQANQAGESSRDALVPSQFDTASEQSAYKTGFADGFGACGGAASTRNSAASTRDGAAATRLAPVTYSQPRVVYRNTGRTARSSSVARSNVAYQQPRGRSFWQKHRDKLTVAMGTGGGAVLGGLIGGKKGAAIGALGGAGGSALYTYKLRKRNRRY